VSALLKTLENTTFPKVDLFPSSGEGNHDPRIHTAYTVSGSSADIATGHRLEDGEVVVGFAVGVHAVAYPAVAGRHFLGGKAAGTRC
jgi:hypothetical protein